MKKYVIEFLRVLSPSGVIIFQLPSEQISEIQNDKAKNGLKQLIKPMIPRGLLDLYRHIKLEYLNQPVMEMHGIKREDMVRFLEENGGQIIDISQPGSYWVECRYCVGKRI